MIPRRALGFVMLGTTVILWVSSSFLVQRIFEGVHFEQPVFVTLFNSASSVSLLVPRLVCGPKSTGDGGKSASATPILDVLRLSGTIGLLWLCAQWIFNVSLLYTSVATNTVLSSTSSVWTFIFSLLICHDPFRWLSFGAASFSFLGCAIVAFQSPRNMHADAVTNSMLGDGLALASAAMFALASVMLRRWAPEEFDTGFFMGMNGLLVLGLSPALLAGADCLGVESFQSPSAHTLAFLALNALLGCTFANYLYTSALLLLSPLIATVCMSLSIPISALTDEVLLQEHRFSAGWAAGAALVSTGVVLAAFDFTDPAPEADDRKGAEAAELQSLLEAEGDEGECDLAAGRECKATSGDV